MSLNILHTSFISFCSKKTKQAGSYYGGSNYSTESCAKFSLMTTGW